MALTDICKHALKADRPVGECYNREGENGLLVSDRIGSTLLISVEEITLVTHKMSTRKTAHIEKLKDTDWTKHRIEQDNGSKTAASD